MKIIEKIQQKCNAFRANDGITIACLGDSVTQGCFELTVDPSGNVNTRFDQAHTYHAYLQQMLASLYPAVPINIINAGLSGGNAPEGAARLDRDVLRHAPDLVIVCFGLNDSCSGPDGLEAYALVEIVNIHDEALKFEPIYRVLFGVDADDVIAELKAYVSGLDGSASRQDIAYLHKNGGGEIVVSTPVRQLPVATLQDFIDGYIAKNPSVTVDYIHGEDSVKALCSKDGTLGFIFSGMGKDELFKTVMFDGALPRKTFSMGHAEDKRYYLECRKITL